MFAVDAKIDIFDVVHIVLHVDNVVLFGGALGVRAFYVVYVRYCTVELNVRSGELFEASFDGVGVMNKSQCAFLVRYGFCVGTVFAVVLNVESILLVLVDIKHVITDLAKFHDSKRVCFI
jgi:hypothetical protein